LGGVGRTLSRYAAVGRRKVFFFEKKKTFLDACAHRKIQQQRRARVIHSSIRERQGVRMSDDPNVVHRPPPPVTPPTPPIPPVAPTPSAAALYGATPAQLHQIGKVQLEFARDLAQLTTDAYVSFLDILYPEDNVPEQGG